MNRVKNFLFITAGLIFLTLILASVLKSVEPRPQTAQQDSSSFEKGYPPPQPTEDAAAIAADLAYEALQASEPDSAAAPSIPDPLPTPVATSIPVARFPVPGLVPYPDGPEFTVIYQDGNTLRAFDQHGENDRLLVDIGQKTDLFISNPGLGVHDWGAPSPDGTKLALILSSEPKPREGRGAGPQFGLYIYDLENETLELLAESMFEPVWSPDSARIAGMRIDPFRASVIDIQTATETTVLSSEQSDFEFRYHFFTWSPTGDRIAFVRSTSMSFTGEIWVADVSGSEEPVKIAPLDMFAGHLAWSPSADILSFTSEMGGEDTPTNPVNLWVVDIDSMKTTQWTKNLFVAGGTPQWERSGNSISFSAVPLLEGTDAAYEIWLLSDRGENLIRLSKDTSDVLELNWIEGTNQILFKKGNEGLWFLDLENGTETKIKEISGDVDFWYFVMP